MNPNEETKATEDLENKCGNTEESEILKQKIDKLYSEIEVHNKEKAEIRMDVERLTLDYESLETENKDLYSKLEQNKNENMKIHKDYTESLATVMNLRLQVASPEAENKRHTLQYSESMNMIDELEFQIESLQKEFAKQAQVFGEDLELVNEVKAEQEQRAIRAEEALKKTRWSSKNVAERLQEEFRLISAEMALKIEENEILAQEAVTEANDLRQKNEVLEELLQKANEELHLLRDQYEMTKQKAILAEESEQRKTTVEESEMLHRWKSEKEDLEGQLASVRKEAEMLMHNNVSVKSQIDLKTIKEENLLLEVKKLRLKNNEVKSLVLELQLEKAGLKKEMSKLQESLRKKEQERERAALQNSITSLVKKKNMKQNTRAGGINVETSRIQTVPAKQLEQKSIPVENINCVVLDGRKNKCENIKGSVQKSSHSDGVFSFLSETEVASLNERNKSMEVELKEMHERYSEISLRFAEVEGERQQLVMTLRNLKSGKKN